MPFHQCQGQGPSFYPLRPATSIPQPLEQRTVLEDNNAPVPYPTPAPRSLSSSLSLQTTISELIYRRTITLLDEPKFDDSTRTERVAIRAEHLFHVVCFDRVYALRHLHKSETQWHQNLQLGATRRVHRGVEEQASGAERNPANDVRCRVEIGTVRAA